MLNFLKDMKNICIETCLKDREEECRLSGSGSECSASPHKVEEAGVSPTPSPAPLPTLVPKSFANTVNTSSSLSIPPLFTSRIPKGDPLEERLHDMLRLVCPALCCSNLCLCIYCSMQQ